jgi:Flp pilus assembly protein TadD
MTMPKPPHAPLALLSATTFAGVLALTGCGGASRGSLAGGGNETQQGAGAEEVEFPDETAARSEAPATPEVLEAETMLAEGRPLEAERRLEAIVRATPNDVRARLDLGLSREMQDDATGAEEAYRGAIEVDATFAEAWNNLGALLREAERVEEGVAALREAVRLRPGFASAQLNLGLALEDSGDDEGAITAYRTVMRLSRVDPTSRTSLGLLLLRQGQRDQALIELRHAVPLAEAREDLAAIGNGLRRAGDPAMAVRVLRQAIEASEEPAQSALRAELALAEFAAGHRDVAEQLLQALIAEDAAYAAAHYLLGNMLAARQAWSEAAREYDAYLRADPRGDDAAEARGRLTYVRSQAH